MNLRDPRLRPAANVAGLRQAAPPNSHAPHAPHDPPGRAAPTLDYETPEDLDAAEPPPPPGDLRGKSVRGSAWTGVSFAVQNVLRLGGNLVVARLLSPELFGIAALVNILIHGLQMLSDLGIGAAIVQRPGGEREAFLRTSFTLQAVRGCALAGVAAGLAWPAAAFYGEPRLRWLIPIAGLGLVAMGLTSTAVHRLARHLMLGRLALLETATQVLAIGGMVAWAAVSPGVLALVVPPTVAVVLKAAISHLLMGDRRDRFGWDAAAAANLVNFSRWILVSTILAFATTQADRLIFGKLIPLELLGVYGIAAMLAQLPRQFVLKLGQDVIFPALSRVGGEAEFTAAVSRTRRPVAVLGGLLVAGLIASGPPLVLAAYDARYAAASWIVPTLAAGIWVEVLSGSNGAVLLSRGLTRGLAAAQLVKAVSLVGGILVGHALHGFPGAVVGVALSEIGGYAVSAWLVGRAGGRVLGIDLTMTLWVAATAAAGYGVGQVVPGLIGGGGGGGEASPLGHLAGFAAAGLAVSALWAAPVLRAVREVRRR